MAVGIDTGHGATIAFGTQGWTGSIISIAGHSDTRVVVPTTTLATAAPFHTSKPGDLNSLEPFTVTCFFAGIDLPDNTVVAETVTVTDPLVAGGSTAMNIAGTAYVTRRKFHDRSTDEMMIAEFDVVWDGETGPTVTDGT